jgi:hypothetical protein
MPTNREGSRNEYPPLMRVIRVMPNSGELIRHTDRPFNRIMRSWISFKDIGVAPSRSRRVSAKSASGPKLWKTYSGVRLRGAA